jgi:hypothetical protein
MLNGITTRSPTAADGDRRDAHDHAGRLLDLRVVDLLDADVSLAMPGECSHWPVVARLDLRQRRPRP